MDKYLMMKTNTLFLQSLYDNCKSLGLVDNQYEFSELCGRKTTWFSANKSRDLPISTTAALTLSIRLRERANNELPRRLQSSARQLSCMLMDWVVEQSKGKQ
jgi:hypothetical protein